MIGMDGKVVLMTPFFYSKIAFGLLLDESGPFGQFSLADL